MAGSTAAVRSARDRADQAGGAISRRIQISAWAAFCFALVMSAYGIYANRLLQQNLWTTPGVRRFAIVALVYVSWCGSFSRIARSWFAPATLTLLLALLVAALGPLPPIAAALFLFSCYVTGTLLLPGPGRITLARGLLQLLLGVSLWMAVLGVLVHFPVNYASVYVTLFLAPLIIKPVVTLSCLAAIGSLWTPLRLQRGIDYLFLAAAGFPVVCHLLVAIMPETGADALAMHLTVPAWISYRHQWHFDFTHTSWAVMPMGGDWCYAAVYLLGGEIAARLLNFSFFIVTTALVYAASRRYVDRATAYLFSAVFASTPLVQLITGSLFIENLWAALLVGAVFALDGFHSKPEPRMLYVTAVLMGAGLATKFGTFAFCVPLTAFVAWELFRWKGPLAYRSRVAVIALWLVTLFGAAPYVFAYVKTGNPVFPFMNQVFHSAGFSRSGFTGNYLLPVGVKTPYDATFHSHQYLESQDGALGFQYLLLAALALAALDRRWHYLAFAGLATSIIFSLATFSATSYLRYIYPALPLMTIAGAAVLGRLHAKCRLLFCSVLATLALAFVLNLYFMPSSGWSHSGFFVNPFNKAEIEKYVRGGRPLAA